ncbi:hypothetical protein [Flavobacterium sp. UBA4854]|uniref:hypothetical protein n=1 Tax=Flavobacterium sp. UBA4854 TaxID=1946548 RepID=UPI00257F5E75|nr:hypothetical protein [Flavobacterium sp. UBA4854]
MEDYAVVLANDLIVKASNFGGINNLKYNREGKVTSFTFEGQKIVALFQFKSNEFLDYVDESYFEKIKEREVQKEGDKYDGVDKKLWENFVFKKYDKLVRAQFGDTIFGLLRDSSGLCYNYHKWIYDNPYKGPRNPQLATEALANGQLCDTFIQGTHAKDFFDTYKNYTFLDTDENDIRLIGEIASLLKTAGEKTAEAFLNFNLTGVDTSKFTFHNNQNQLSRTELLEYKKGLELWLKMLKKYQTEISKLGHEEQLFIALDVMYRHNMLTLLTVDQRISILKILVEKKALMNWYWVNFSIGFVHKEDLAIHILESVTNTSDASSFLDKLVSKKVIESEYKDHQGVLLDTKEVTLYKMLFYRMDDYGGKDNFTAFIKELERIVLLKYNIIEQNIPPTISVEELKNTTKAQFIWREKGPKKGRIKYEIISNTDKKIKFKNTVVLKTELREKSYSNSLNMPVISVYEEIPTQIDSNEFELNHFDLVSIHFYNNPSFVDLTSDASYIGQHYYTFAGFIDYILEKEDSKIAEDVFNAALFLISFGFGIGELVAALRGANVARAFIAGGMIISDTGVYLTQNIEFKNYLVSKYGVERANIILSNLAILSTIGSIGSNALGTGILNTYSRVEALEFVGTGEAILKDSIALETMTSNQIMVLEESIKRVKNELYPIRNIPESTETIINIKATVFFDKFTDLEAGINTLSSTNKLLFYNKFVNLSEKELDILRSIWLQSDEIGRLKIIEDSEIWIKTIKSRRYLKNGEYNKISVLFNKSIQRPYTSSNGLKFIAEIEDVVANDVLRISQDTQDIIRINSNLNADIEIISTVKEHFFITEHFVRNDIANSFIIGRFGKYTEDIELWDAFSAANPTSSQIHIRADRLREFQILLAHEYIESELMKLGLNFRSFEVANGLDAVNFGAHELSPLFGSGGSYSSSGLESGGFLDLNRLKHPPAINYDNLTKLNLDNVVNWYKDFYKL